MKNVNEPRSDISAEIPPEAPIIPMGGVRKTATEPPLIPKRELEDLRARWIGLQSTFVDNPRKAVEDANTLVTSAMKQIDETFRYQRSQIEKQMTKGNASTEDMRVALQQYRALLDRLLSF